MSDSDHPHILIIPVDEVVPPAPRCINCGAELTSDDPAVTTLGPRCRRHF